MRAISRGADVGGVRRGTRARFVTREQKKVVEVDISGLLEGVVFLGRNARRVALRATHHLERKVIV